MWEFPLYYRQPFKLSTVVPNVQFGRGSQFQYQYQYSEDGSRKPGNSLPIILPKNEIRISSGTSCTQDPTRNFGSKVGTLGQSLE